MPPLVGKIAVPLQTPVPMVPTVERLDKVVRLGKVVVADNRTSKRESVQYKLVPSATFVVNNPKDEVAICPIVPVPEAYKS